MVNCLLRICVLLPFNKERKKKIEERKVRIIRYVGDQGQISSFDWSISGLQRLYKDQLTTNSTINPSLGWSPGGLHKNKNKISKTCCPTLVFQPYFFEFLIKWEEQAVILVARLSTAKSLCQKRRFRVLLGSSRHKRKGWLVTWIFTRMVRCCCFHGDIHRSKVKIISKW